MRSSRKSIRAVEFRRLPIRIVRPGDPCYPSTLAIHQGIGHPLPFTAIGNLRLLEDRLIGLVCSARCPGPVILEMYDVVSSIDPEGWVVVGGFHSPMERQCLEVLIARRVPVVFCAARPLEGMRIPVAWRTPLAEDRILILSPFLEGNRRATKGTASHRNRFVAALASVLLIPYARAGGVAEAIAQLAVNWRKGVVTVSVNDQPLMQEIGAGTLAHLETMSRSERRGKRGATLVLTPE